MTASPVRPSRDASETPDEALHGMIRGFPAALFTTVDAHGIMHTRQIPNTNTEFRGSLSFLSVHDAPIITEVSAHHDVLVTFAERGTSRFVVLNGTASVRDDPARVRELWHPLLAAWIPEGTADGALSVIEVNVSKLEFWT